MGRCSVLTDKSRGSSNASQAQSALFAPTHAANLLRVEKTIRIAVSDDVPVTKTEIEIIDTPEFQRLRSLKQLASTYLVYPTALHTRFDHSLGTLSIATEMIRAIRENAQSEDDERKIDEEQELLIRLLALLHDIAHIPFGHTLEDEFSIFPRHDEDPDRINRFLGDDSNIGRIIRLRLGEDLYQRFKRIYTITKSTMHELKGDLFIYDLVNNTVCADLLDYLRRDCYFCNLDLDTNYRFLKYLYLAWDGPTRRVVVRLWKEGRTRPRADVLSELIRLLDNRYLLGERVYFHHAKLISGTMLAAATQRAVMADVISKSKLYEFGDEAFLQYLKNVKEPTTKRLTEAFCERRLWKSVFEKSRQLVEAEDHLRGDINVMETIENSWWSGVKQRTNDERYLAKALGIDDGDILIHCPKSTMAMKLAEMKVIWNGRVTALKDCLGYPLLTEKLNVILDSHKSLWAIRAFANPITSGSGDAIRQACDHLFCFHPDQEKNYENSFLRIISKRIAREEGLDKEMTASEYDQREEQAVVALAGQRSSGRDWDVTRKLVIDALKGTAAAR